MPLNLFIYFFSLAYVFKIYGSFLRFGLKELLFRCLPAKPCVLALMVIYQLHR